MRDKKVAVMRDVQYSKCSLTDQNTSYKNYTRTTFSTPQCRDRIAFVDLIVTLEAGNS
jgi:hypothetical protein